MNAEDMSYEELLALAKIKQAQQGIVIEAKPNMRRVTVRGIPVTIDETRLASWRAFELVGKMDSDKLSEFEKMDAAFETVEFLTGMSKAEVIGELGGDLADVRDVTEFVAEVIQAAYPKD